MKSEILKLSTLVEHLYYQIPSIVELQVSQIMKDRNNIIRVLQLINLNIVERNTILLNEDKIFQNETHIHNQTNLIVSGVLSVQIFDDIKDLECIYAQILGSRKCIHWKTVTMKLNKIRSYQFG
jgi:hypothetical protein